MSSAAGYPTGMTLPRVGTPLPVAPSRGTGDGTASSTPAAEPTAPPAEDAVTASPEQGLAALLSQARRAQAQLVAQPLAITNYNGQLILKLLGG